MRDSDESAQTNAPFPIVGIGASAGGLEAFTQLLNRLPATTGMAFVLVQHLDPHHESALTELLSRSSKMPVTEVTEGVRVEVDHVYVIPPNRSMTLSGGVLHLAKREQRELHMPINEFLQSLAADQHSNAIGVILSGTASDGALGLEAIKLEGGITFAQEGRSAKYDSMPRNAVASGCVDVTLPPDGIARELMKIASHPYLRHGTPSASGALPGEEGDGLPKIFALLQRTFGINFRLYRQTTLRRRIMRRMLLRKARNLDAYIHYLRGHDDELQALHEDLLIGVTSFFREAKGLDALKRKVFPRLLKDRSPDQPIRVWVPGCSTGQEAYSLAIALDEFLEDRGDHPLIHIFGTDVNEAAIQKARAGIYTDASTSDIPPARLRRFFTLVNGHQQVVKRIRDLCVFAKHDLTRDPPFSNMDLITCCNVLIYLESPVQKQVLQIFHYALKPTGVLMLGHSESVGAASDLFTPVNRKHQIHVRKAGRAVAGFSLVAGGRSVEMSRPGRAAASPPSGGIDVPGALDKDVQRLLLKEYAPAGVVVNERLEVVHFTGNTHPYVQPASGAASFNLLKMTPERLAVALRMIIQDAKRKHRPVRKEGVQVTIHGHTTNLNLKATPIRGGATGDSYVLVTFESATTGRPAAGRAAKTARRKGHARPSGAEADVTQLKQELASAREYVQAVLSDQEAANEELRSANEEILSSNEELQSTNEELETAKEELQSSNEELTTLNEEVQNRNVELRQLGDDLANVLNSTTLAIVLLDRNLRIRRFTPAAERALHLIAADVGRAIGDVKLPMAVADLEPLILEVIATAAQTEREVQDREGRWFLLTIRVYRTLDHDIDGAVLVWTDIDQLKRSQEEIATARDYAEAIVETVREPLVVLDERQSIVSANRSFYEFFRTTRRDTAGHSLFEIGGHQWDVPTLRRLLDDVIAEKAFEGFEITVDFPLGRRMLLLNARQVWDRPAASRLILLAFEDVTERPRRKESSAFAG